MINTWDSYCVTPEEEGTGTKVLDTNDNFQPTLEAGDNIVIDNGQISASGTLENVQADWSTSDPSDPSYIQHKPQNLVQDADYVHIDNNFTDADVSKLEGIEAGAQVNVKPDWDAVAGSDAEILNKPTIPLVDQIYNANSTNAQSGVAVASAVSGAVSGINQVPASTSTDSGKVLKVNAQGNAEWGTDEGTTYTAGNGLSLSGTEFSVDTTVVATQNDLSDYQPVISDLATIRSGAAAGATAVQPSSLATVATTGSYDDLLDKPTIPPGVTVDQTYNASSTNAQSGTAVAGAIATKQDTISDLSTIRSGAAAGATAVQPGSLATVATTGSYADLSNKPTIPTVDQSYNSASTNAQSGTAVAQAIAAIPLASYTAGEGIAIENGEISVDYDNDTLSTTATTSTTLATFNSVASYIVQGEYQAYLSCTLSEDMKSALNHGMPVQSVTVHIPGTTFQYPLNQQQSLYLELGITEYFNNKSECTRYVSTPVAATFNNIYGGYVVDEQDLTVTLPCNPSRGWTAPEFGFNGIAYMAIVVWYTADDDPSTAPVSNEKAQLIDASTPATITISAAETVPAPLHVTNPVPAPASDAAGKVLTVTDTQGNYGWQPVPQELPTLTGHGGEVLKVNSGATGVEWATPSSGPTYTAGDGIAITSDTIAAKVGGGIKIGTASATSTTTEQLQMTTDSMSKSVYGFGTLSTNAANALNNGDTVSVELSYNFTANYQAPTAEMECKYYAAIAQFAGKYNSLMDGVPYLILGEVTPSSTIGSTATFSSGLSIDYNVSDISSTLSNNLTWSTVQANPGSYQFGLLMIHYYYGAPDAMEATKYYDGSWSTVTLNTATATIPTTVNVPNSIVLEHPIELVQSLPASPDSNTLYLIPEA